MGEKISLLAAFAVSLEWIADARAHDFFEMHVRSLSEWDGRKCHVLCQRLRAHVGLMQPAELPAMVRHFGNEDAARIALGVYETHGASPGVDRVIHWADGITLCRAGVLEAFSSTRQDYFRRASDRYAVLDGDARSPGFGGGGDSRSEADVLLAAIGKARLATHHLRLPVPDAVPALEWFSEHSDDCLFHCGYSALLLRHFGPPVLLDALARVKPACVAAVACALARELKRGGDASAAAGFLARVQR